MRRVSQVPIHSNGKHARGERRLPNIRCELAKLQYALEAEIVRRERMQEQLDGVERRINYEQPQRQEVQ